MRMLVAGLGVFASFTVLGPAIAQQPSWDKLWEQRDAAALAQRYAEDAEFFNTDGQIWRGRSEIENGFARTFAAMRETLPEETAARLDFQIFFTSRQTIATDVTIIDGVWQIEGLPEDDDTWAKLGRWSWLSVRRDGQAEGVWHTSLVPSFVGHQSPKPEYPGSAGKSDPKTVQKAQELLQGYVAAVEDSDSRGIMDQFTPDGAFAPAGSLAWRIGSTIQEWYEDSFERNEQSNLSKFEVTSARNITPEVLLADGFKEGPDASEDSANEMLRTRFFAILVKGDTAWKIKRLCFWFPYSPPSLDES